MKLYKMNVIGAIFFVYMHCFSMVNNNNKPAVNSTQPNSNFFVPGEMAEEMPMVQQVNQILEASHQVPIAQQQSHRSAAPMHNQQNEQNTARLQPYQIILPNIAQLVQAFDCQIMKDVDEWKKTEIAMGSLLASVSQQLEHQSELSQRLQRLILMRNIIWIQSLLSHGGAVQNNQQQAAGRSTSSSIPQIIIPQQSFVYPAQNLLGYPPLHNQFARQNPGQQ